MDSELTTILYVIGLMAVVEFMFIYFAIKSYTKLLALKSHLNPRISAVVTRLFSTRSDKSIVLNIEYKFEADGKEIISSHHKSIKITEDLQPNDEVLIVYLRENPEVNYFDRYLDAEIKFKKFILTIMLPSSLIIVGVFAALFYFDGAGNNLYGN